MKTFYLLLALLLFYGCSDNNIEERSAPVFSISLSPKLAGNFPTLIPVNSQLIVHATEPLDFSTVNTQTVYIRDLSDGARPESIVQTLATTTGQAISIRPVAYLIPDNDYELVVTTDVTTETGEQRSSNAVINFTTGPSIDTTAPTLVGSLPEDGTTVTLEKFAIISFQFDEPLLPFSIQNVQINVKEDGPTTGPGVEGELVLSGSVLSFIPKVHFTAGSDYRIELNTTHIMDLSGNPYNAATVVTRLFSVIPTQDSTPLIDFNGVADYNLSTQVNSMASSGDDLYVGTAKGLDIFTYDNTATPTKLVHRSHLEDELIGTVYSLALDMVNQRAYLGTSRGFSTVDISDINHTTLISHVDTLNGNGYFTPVYGLDYAQTHLYLAASSLGVLDINITDVSAPAILQTRATKSPTFDLRVMDNFNIALSSYGNGISSVSRSSLTETDILQETVYSHNLFARANPNDGNDYFYSAGIKGLGILETTGTAQNNNFTQTEAYVTRVLDRDDKSIAILKNLGLGFFSATGGFYEYHYLTFEPTAITYIENLTGLGNDMLILADRTGQLYLQVID